MMLVHLSYPLNATFGASFYCFLVCRITKRSYWAFMERGGERELQRGGGGECMIYRKGSDKGSCINSGSYKKNNI